MSHVGGFRQSLASSTLSSCWGFSPRHISPWKQNVWKCILRSGVCVSLILFTYAYRLLLNLCFQMLNHGLDASNYASFPFHRTVLFWGPLLYYFCVRILLIPSTASLCFHEKTLYKKLPKNRSFFFPPKAFNVLRVGPTAKWHRWCLSGVFKYQWDKECLK